MLERCSARKACSARSGSPACAAHPRVHVQAPHRPAAALRRACAAHASAPPSAMQRPGKNACIRNIAGRYICAALRCSSRARATPRRARCWSGGGGGHELRRGAGRGASARLESLADERLVRGVAQRLPAITEHLERAPGRSVPPGRAQRCARRPRTHFWPLRTPKRAGGPGTEAATAC